MGLKPPKIVEESAILSIKIKIMMNIKYFHVCNAERSSPGSETIRR